MPCHASGRLVLLRHGTISTKTHRERYRHVHGKEEEEVKKEEEKEKKTSSS